MNHFSENPTENQVVIHPPVPYKCDLCNYATKIKGDYERHLMTLKHILRSSPDVECLKSPPPCARPPPPPPPLPSLPYICDICQKGYSTMRGLKLHIRKSHGNDQEDTLQEYQRAGWPIAYPPRMTKLQYMTAILAVFVVVVVAQYVYVYSYMVYMYADDLA